MRGFPCMLIIATSFVRRISGGFSSAALAKGRLTMSAMSQAQASNGSSAPAPARIAILGGGAAGLVAARILSRQQRRKGNNDIVIKVLEKDDSFAGVWNYQSRSSTRPMYRNLRTNLPKEIMAYREFPWPPANNKHHHETSFVTHKNVADYLRQYCDHFCLQQYIQTGCRVDQLTCLPNTRSRLSPNTSGDDSEAAVWPQIRLDWTDKNMNVSTNKDSTSRQCSEIFDAVYVCNGHYSVPAFPEIPGLHQYFTGTTLHSIAYDVPEAFANQTVLCVGGRASGSDLAREIAKTASTVYLSDSAFPVTSDQPSITQHNVTWLPKTTEILPDGRVAFAPTIANAATGQHVITHPPVQVDTIIFCSGYDYNFPFINERSNLELNAANRRVQPLFEQLWHADAPNVAFIGLPHSVIPFPLFELQAEAVARSWRLGDGNNDDNDNDNNSRMQQLQIPTGVSERKRAANADAASGGPNGGRVPEDTHYLGSAQWDYCRRMAAYAGILDDALEGYLVINQTIYEDASLARTGDFPSGPDVYRLICYERDSGSRTFRSWTIEDSAAIWDHSGEDRKGKPPGSPDDYRETGYERHSEAQSFKVLRSLAGRVEQV